MIRPMTEHDIGSIQHILHVTWNDTYEGIIPEDIQTAFINRSFSDAMMQKRMEKTHVIVAESDDGTPIGFINFTRKDEDGDSELTAMYILPEYQHAGYGRKLMDYAFSTLGDAQQLFVYVDSRNCDGCRFYEKMGFELLDTFEELFEGYPVETAQYVYYVRQPALV